MYAQYHRSAARPTRVVKRALLIGSQLNLVATTVDLQSMDEVLRSHGFITRTVGGTDRPATRAGILKAIDTLTQETSKGEAVVVYYTGHGMITERDDNQNARRVNTSDNTDRWRLQYIVPIDFGDSTVGDFRGITDLELSQKLAALSEKTDNITLILDCCHSTRIARAGATVKSLYPGQYPRAFAHIQTMINNRHFQDNLYAVGNPSVVRIVAAQATEPAYEDSIRSPPGSKCIHKSVLTEALVEALQHAVAKQIRMSWDRIMLRVRDRVLATMPTQHPGIEGPSRRFCFETAEDQFQLGLPVSRNRAGDYILQGGYLHGVTDKDKYAIMPTEATTVQSNLQVAEARVSVVRDKDATLKMTWMGSHRSLSDRGAHAILTRRGLKKSSVIIEMSGLLLEQLSDAIESSKCLRIGHSIATQLACVKQEGHHVTLKDARDHTIRKYLLAECSDPDIIPRGMIAILEALDRAKHVLGLQGAAPDVWPRQDVSVEFGIVNGGDVPKRPFQIPGEDVKEGQSVYFEIKNSGRKGVYVSVLDICLHHVTLCESNFDIPAGRTRTIGNTVAGTLKGLKISWPPEVPRNQSIMATAVIVLTDREIDLRNLETVVTSGGGMRNQKGSDSESEENDLMSMVDQIVNGDSGPVPKVMERAEGPKFGIWTCEYKVVPENQKVRIQGRRTVSRRRARL